LERKLFKAICETQDPHVHILPAAVPHQDFVDQVKIIVGQVIVYQASVKTHMQQPMEPVVQLMGI
jgi:hypothetical protein